MTVETPKEGIYPGVPFTEYLEWDAINDSFLSELVSRSPAHAKATQEEPKDTEAFRIGRALHTRALEPGVFEQRYAIRPDCDRRTKDGKAIYEAWVASLDGKEELSQAEAESIDAMCKAMERLTIHRWIEQGKAEVCIVWRDARTGILCKGRLDYWQEELNAIVDLKSCQDASARAFARDVFGYRYYQKAAWYCDGLGCLTGQDPSFVFIAVEKKRPYACAAYQLEDTAIIGGRKAYRKALDIYRECAATNYWPGYPDRVEILSLPAWALGEMGVGQYNLVREDEINGNENNEPKTTHKRFISGSSVTDWDALERDARDAEQHPEG